MERIPVKKYQGVYFREHSTRRHEGQPDRCFDISYKTPNGKKVWEKVGWASEGYTASQAATIRGVRIQAIRHGEELPKKKQEPTLGEL